ncbi:MAG: hypothetical protein Q9219_002232 [cf. Caloplaca sp. 3 TL-2023]
MPPAADTPSKPFRRHRRKTKTSSISQNNCNEISDDAIARQITSDLDLPDQATEASPSFRSAAASRSRPVPHVHDGANGLTSSADKRTATPRKSQGGRQSGSSPRPKLTNTPQPSHWTNALTPGKKSTTPSQAYAGPTFHASPAASSLPMPKFLSKSVPEVDKVPGMQSLIGRESAETSSEQSEDSPTPAFARRVGEEQKREESPLDIFFKADREQKERQLKGQDPPLSTPEFFNPTSASNRVRHHSRHSTNGSMGPLFAMEMEGAEPDRKPPEKQSPEATIDTAEPYRSAGMEVKETPQQTAQRKAKTMALKKLLLSSMPSASTPSSCTPEEPMISNETIPDMSSSQQPKHASSQIHKQIAAQTARQASPCPRPSSNLRKEMSASTLPDTGQIPELPSSPTPSRTRNAHKSLPRDYKADPSGESLSLSSPAPYSSHRSIPVPKGAEVSSSPYKTMEDDLRRILKLNIIPGDGATGVRS